MLKLLPLVLPLLFLLAALPAGGQERPGYQPLWPGGAPGAQGTETRDVPALSPYLVGADRATGAAVVICPGGGYGALADHEGHPVALWLNSLGIHAFILRYRLGPRYRHPIPLQDAQRAIRHVRANAAGLGVDPERIGILGFSAGGHLAATASTTWEEGSPTAADGTDRVSSRPNASILIYPVITFTDPYTHAGSRNNLLGPNPPAELVEKLSNEKQVTPRTPPAFLVHSHEDGPVPAENSLAYAMALRRARVPVELHLYEKGPHGFGLALQDPVLKTWTERCAAWLKLRGFAR